MTTPKIRKRVRETHLGRRLSEAEIKRVEADAAPGTHAAAAAQAHEAAHAAVRQAGDRMFAGVKDPPNGADIERMRGEMEELWERWIERGHEPGGCAAFLLGTAIGAVAMFDTDSEDGQPAITEAEREENLVIVVRSIHQHARVRITEHARASESEPEPDPTVH